MPAIDGRNAYDLRLNSSAIFPPEYYVNYLHEESVMEKIGAQTQYKECPTVPGELFEKTGDVRRADDFLLFQYCLLHTPEC